MVITVHTINEALNACPYRKGMFDTYFHLDDTASAIITEAEKRGYINRRSHTQAEWTDQGLLKAIAELTEVARHVTGYGVQGVCR